MKIRSRADWREIIRAWMRDKPSGYAFKSPEVYRWVQANVPLAASDHQKQQRSDREMWRVHLSNALSDLHHAGELVHPGCSHLAWMVP